jgi:hypothetical protein
VVQDCHGKYWQTQPLALPWAIFTELFANVNEPLVKKINERLRDSPKNVAIKQKKILSLVLKA